MIENKLIKKEGNKLNILQRKINYQSTVKVRGNSDSKKKKTVIKKTQTVQKWPLLKK